ARQASSESSLQRIENAQASTPAEFHWLAPPTPGLKFLTVRADELLDHKSEGYEVISARYVSMFEMGEYQGGVGDIPDLARTGNDVLQSPPTLAQQGKAAFTNAAH